MSTGAAADTMLPRHSMQLPSPEWSLCCGEADSRWCVQPSGQQIPSIAFRDANTTSIAIARNLRTIRLWPASGSNHTGITSIQIPSAPIATPIVWPKRRGDSPSNIRSPTMVPMRTPTVATTIGAQSVSSIGPECQR